MTVRSPLFVGSLLVALSAIACAPASDPPPAGDRVRSRGEGIAGDLFGINVATDAPGAAAVEALGARWVRVELRDETSGPNLSAAAIDRVAATLSDYHARGIKVLLVVDYTTRASFLGFCPQKGGWWSTWRSEFLSRVAHAAQTFGDEVDAWQIWNEPDHPCGAAPDYDPFVPAAELAWLSKDAFAAIRTGSSSPVVLGGLESGNAGYMDDMVAATGGSLWDYANGIAIQIYGVVPNDSWCVPGGPAEGEYLNCDWGRHDGKVHEYYERSGGLPVWVTEVGFRTEDTFKAANYLEDAYVAFASTGDRLAHVFWFAYSDAMVAPFGLTDEHWSPKPWVYERYQRLAGVASGGSGGGGGGGALPTCGDLAWQNGWAEAYCEWNGNGACNGQGPATSDCDHCCEPPSLGPSCGELAWQNGWAEAYCEWNGNGACGGEGPSTWDCDHCCPAY